MCCTNAGTVFAWGDIDAKSIEGTALASATPTLKSIHSLAGIRIVRVYCGAQFAATLDDRFVFSLTFYKIEFYFYLHCAFSFAEVEFILGVMENLIGLVMVVLIINGRRKCCKLYKVFIFICVVLK